MIAHSKKVNIMCVCLSCGFNEKCLFFYTELSVSAALARISLSHTSINMVMSLRKIYLITLLIFIRLCFNYGYILENITLIQFFVFDLNLHCDHIFRNIKFDNGFQFKYFVKLYCTGICSRSGSDISFLNVLDMLLLLPIVSSCDLHD